jgi:uncharacterized membrane protein
MFGISKLRLTFEAQGGAALFYALVALGALFGVIYFYRWLVGRTDRVYLVLLGTLRVLAVSLVVLLLFRPVLSFERRTTQKPVLLVGIDNSRSMSIADVEHRPNRFQSARNLLLQGGVWDALEDDFEVSVTAVGQQSVRVEGPRQLGDMEPDSEATAFALSLRTAAEQGGRRPERVLLLSDGQDNSGGAPDVELVKMGVPVDCIGVGTALLSENRFTDVALTDVQTKPTAAAEELAEISVFVEAWGFEGENCEVSLWDKGLYNQQPPPAAREVARQRIVLDGKRGSQEIKLNFTPKEVGLHQLAARSERKPGEKLSENNEAEFLLSVTEPQIKVLYLDTVRGESKFLKNAFARDPHVRLMSLIKVRQDVFLQSGDVAGLKLDRIPESGEVFSRFDVLIVGNLDAVHFSPAARAAMRSWVENGKGILWLGGEEAFGPGGYVGAELERLIPVRMGGKSDGFVKEPFQMRISVEGAHHPMLAGCDRFFVAVGGATLPTESLQNLELLNRCLGPAPGAGVLAEHVSEKTPEGRLLPVFVVGQAGSGRSAAFLAGPTWPWLMVMQGAGRETPYHKLWGQTLRWLAGEEAKFGGATEPLQAHMGRAFYHNGETAVIYARALDASGQLTGEAAIEAAVVLPDGKTTQTLSLAAQGDHAGSYQARWRPEVSGTYKVTVKGKLGDRDLGKVDLTFAVGKPNQEFDRLDLNEALLRRIAEKTGGRYLSLADAGVLIRELQSTERSRRKLTELSLFNLPLFFLLFVGLVTAEWVLRKRQELL